MRNRELELRKRALEAQFQADVELGGAGYQARGEPRAARHRRARHSEKRQQKRR
jgi:hypothetical protein